MFATALLPQPAQLLVRPLNALLRREDWARHRLMDYAGKTVRLASGKRSLTLTLGHDGYVQPSDPAISADVVLTLPQEHWGSLPGLIQQGNVSQISTLMHVQGEAGLANLVSELARSLRWDYEDDLARLIGDMPAMRLLDLSRTVLQGARGTARKLLANTAEFLGEEGQMLVQHHSQIEWAQQVQSLQTVLDRLEQRVGLLEVKQ